jgi:hypothetical protein
MATVPESGFLAPYSGRMGANRPLGSEYDAGENDGVGRERRYNFQSGTVHMLEVNVPFTFFFPAIESFPLRREGRYTFATKSVFDDKAESPASAAGPPGPSEPMTSSAVSSQIERKYMHRDSFFHFKNFPV